MGGRAGGLLVLDEVQKIRDWSDVVKQLWDEDTRGRHSPAGHAPRLGAAARATGAVRQPGRPLRDRPGHALDVRRDARRLRLGPRHLSLLRRLSGRRAAHQEPRPMGGVHPRLDRRDEPLARHPPPQPGREARAPAPAVPPRLLVLGPGAELHEDARHADRCGQHRHPRPLPRAPRRSGDGRPASASTRARRSGAVRSSPKLLALNTALDDARRRGSGSTARRPIPSGWARLVQTAVGAHLWAHADPDELGWWREGNNEVDWVVRPGQAHALARRADGHRRSGPATRAARAGRSRSRRPIVARAR